MMGLDFVGRVFEDNFLIADVVMEADFPTERWFWFDPPFNRGQSALLHKQPDNVWRIDLQLGWDIDKEKRETARARDPAAQGDAGRGCAVRAGMGVDLHLPVPAHGEFPPRPGVIFAGDAAHQVSPFGARGANSGLQDTDNLCWKLKLVLDGKAPESAARQLQLGAGHGADENILNSSRSTDFITPKSDLSRIFRDAVLDLAERHDFARPLREFGPAVGALHGPLRRRRPLNGPDARAGMPWRAQPIPLRRTGATALRLGQPYRRPLRACNTSSMIRRR
jgi:3-(3-hydroxy-phenyl)propionate hydroxylase